MSRIGKMPIEIPSGVKIKSEKDMVTVEGSKGKLSQSIPQGISLKLEDKRMLVERKSEEKSIRALHGLMRSLIYNMVKGVTEGFKKELSIVGVGYRAQLKDNKLVIQLGFSHPIEYKAPKGIDFAVEDKGVKIIVSGYDKQLVGEVASIIRRFRKPEPYRGKGIRYVGEYVRKKAGKAAASASGK